MSVTVAPSSEEPAGEASVTQVAVLDREPLLELEQRGFGLAQLAVDQRADDNAELSRIPALRGLFQTLARDVQAAARPYPLSRVTS
ncbi:MAG TPA: hypothetical protein VEQ59_18610, partial [Polyangiaceae bacterium]|nr:hypothetical protein [Polyangiaceae bacterium]